MASINSYSNTYVVPDIHVPAYLVYVYNKQSPQKARICYHTGVEDMSSDGNIGSTAVRAGSAKTSLFFVLVLPFRNHLEHINIPPCFTTVSVAGPTAHLPTLTFIQSNFISRDSQKKKSRQFSLGVNNIFFT